MRCTSYISPIKSRTVDLSTLRYVLLVVEHSNVAISNLFVWGREVVTILQSSINAILSYGPVKGAGSSR